MSLAECKIFFLTSAVMIGESAVFVLMFVVSALTDLGSEP